MQRRSLTEKETAQRQEFLLEEIRRLNAIKGELQCIREKATLP
jgi:hypothetical protein